jgi:hypothetical protein
VREPNTFMPGESTIHESRRACKACVTSWCGGRLERLGHLVRARLRVRNERVDERRLAHARLADEDRVLPVEPVRASAMSRFAESGTTA